ncbi:MAG: hypothetical protein AAFR79_18325 [Pseudomonadota bacterium]
MPSPLSAASFSRRLRQLGFGLVLFGGALSAIVLGVGAPEISEPKQRLAQGVGMLALGGLAYLGGMLLRRRPWAAAPFLALLGVAMSVAALAIDLPMLDSFSDEAALAVRLFLIVSWWVLTVLAVRSALKERKDGVQHAI